MIFEIFQVFKHAIVIAGFVFSMMLVIEYINVQTHGVWQNKLSTNSFKQYFFAAFLGIIPGCLGAFTSVALYSHQLISFGAIVTTMIATSGDEAFVMFAMFPKYAIILTLALLVISIFAGYVVDKIPYSKKLLFKMAENKLPLHEKPNCKCFQKESISDNFLKPSIYRLVLAIVFIAMILAVSFGMLAGSSKIWIRVSIILAISFSLFIVATVPEHFIRDHVWKHIVKVHLLKIFLWTFGTLLVLHFLMIYIDVDSWLNNNLLLVLLIAVLVGIIPESGPHLVFVTLFASGGIPFSILLASSIAQDGHGMLPLLAESKKSFLAVKIVNIIFALIFGYLGYFMGF